MRLLYSVLKNVQRVRLFADEIVLRTSFIILHIIIFMNIHPWPISGDITNSTDLFFGKVNIEISLEASDNEIRARILKAIIILCFILCFIHFISGRTKPVHTRLLNRWKHILTTMFVELGGVFIEVKYRYLVGCMRSIHILLLTGIIKWVNVDTLQSNIMITVWIILWLRTLLGDYFSRLTRLTDQCCQFFF